MAAELTPLEQALARLDPSTREDFDERAGIMENDGGLSRAEAEREAWKIVVLRATPR